MAEPAENVPAVAVVVSRYNGSVTGRLREGAAAAYARAGGDPGALEVVEAPGAFELPALSLAAARTGRFAGVVALGCIIQGETSHGDHIAGAVAKGLVDVTMATGVPVCFGVLTVDTPEQAAERAGGRWGNKGEEAMEALLETVAAAAAVGDGRRVASGSAKPDKAATGAGR